MIWSLQDILANLPWLFAGFMANFKTFRRDGWIRACRKRPEALPRGLEAIRGPFFGARGRPPRRVDILSGPLRVMFTMLHHEIGRAHV